VPRRLKAPTVLVSLIFGFALLQLLLALAAPTRFLSVSLLLQAVPFSWTVTGLDGFVSTPVGNLNVIAIQTFFLCLASITVLITKLDRTVVYLTRYKLHVVFLLFCAASILYAPSGTYALRMVAKLAGPLLFMLAMLVATEDQSDILRLRRAILYSGLLLVALALIARALGINSDPNSVITGLSGLGPPGMGSAVFAAHMLPVTMLALAIYVAERRFIYLVMAAIFAASVLGALQRTCAGALFVGTSLILLLGTKGIARIFLPAACLLSFPPLLLFSDAFRRRMFFDVTDPQELLRDPMYAFSSVNGSGRFDLWSGMLDKFFVGHRVFGSGIGATQDFLYTQSQAGMGVVHSEYVRLLCEVGIVGLVFFALAMIAYMLSIAHVYKATRSSPYPLAALAALLCYLIYMTTDNAFDYVIQFGSYVFAIVALAIKAQELSVPADSRTIQRLSMVPINLMR
jgi:hypothetical protein